MKLDGIFSPTILENVTATEFLVCFVMKKEIKIEELQSTES